MTRITALAAIFLFSAGVSACDSPSPRMMGANQKTVEVGGSTFGVHWNDDEAEIYRTSHEMMPSRSATFAKAEKAVMLASGCKVVTMAGDPALMVAKIDCG